MSILLFQAVMFAAVGFVDESLIVEAGFATRKDAKRVFYHKASVGSRPSDLTRSDIQDSCCIRLTPNSIV